MRSMAGAVLVVGLIGSAGSGADDPQKLLVGVWEIAYTDAAGGIPVGTKLALTENGHVLWTIKDKDGKERTEDIGGYKLDRDYFVLTGKGKDKNDKARIVLLNKSSLVLNDEVEDKVMVLKRVKPK